MTRDDPTALLIAIVRRVPVLAIDLPAAEARGDHDQVAYHRAMQAWRAEASAAIAELQRGNPIAATGRAAALA